MQNQNFSKIYSSKKVVSCDGSISNSRHPLIYLNLLPKGSNICPYCSLEYVYKDNKSSSDKKYSKK